MKESIRLFVAAALPPALLSKLQDQLQHFEHPTLRMLPPQNLHLTLYFIGNVPHQELPGIKARVARVAQQHQPFTLQFERTEPGPKPKSPRLVWARFAPHPAFESLSRHLTEELAEQPPEKHKAIPHITLARYRKDAKPPKQLPYPEAEEPLELPVQEVALWQSVLGSPHPTYKVLERYPLG
ncbi:RNA 2',3'-cyclic phosphodiesterase [Pontibacter anaerobius]|uniref:RNA 2',3'-cyclic phosphodiesterase n=1 Tax=Pontibacter anaerobius TaxID=2993940 RepID=A0ABT3RET6_9BACT|nr:RNA 2',3'-cyclic phosphodiesterase [Pontibacter anaerobius]MCX2740026.1 RNA 2',3'-cyclic phosphodiesterase [Pontibacter anaerobius]